jgi:cytochrome P450
LWGLSIFPLFRLHLQGAIYDKFGELNRQHGPLVRIGPKTLLVSDPDVLRRMSAARSPYTRSDWYIAMRLNPGQDNVLAQRNEEKHDDLRRRMVAGYSGKENLTLEKDIDECVLDLVHLIEHKYSNSRGQLIPMDLAQKVQFFTSDVMSKLSFGAKFHDLRDDNDNLGYIHEVETMFPNIFCTCTIPRVIEFLTDFGFLGLFAPSVNSKLGLGKVLAITKEQTAKRFDIEGKPKSDHSDMLGSFVRHGLTKEEAESESVMQLYGVFAPRVASQTY